MKGYDILTQLRTLTPEQLDNWLQYFWGKVGCDFEGFRDSEDRPEFPYAKYVTEQATESFGYISMERPDLHRVERDAVGKSVTIRATPNTPYCPKHGCNLETSSDGVPRSLCPRCKFEEDHPPIMPLGHENLSAEDLQKRHQNLSQRPLVATADSVENEPRPNTDTVKVKCYYDAIVSIANEQASIKQQKQEMIDAYLAEKGGKFHLKPIRGEAYCPHCDCKRNFTSYQSNVIKCQVCCKEVNIHPMFDWTPKFEEIKQEMIDGLLVSTDTLAYHLIPVIAIERLCERIMYGEQTKGEHAWNAMSANQSVLDSAPALARRFGHTINHAYKLLGKLQRGEAWTEEDEREASAVMWGGMYAIAAIHQQRKKETP